VGSAPARLTPEIAHAVLADTGDTEPTGVFEVTLFHFSPPSRVMSRLVEPHSNEQ
jgi:hypothetical protein